MASNNEVAQGGQVGETRYTTKVCPRCGARLFEDMDVCYGCLFDFKRTSKAPSLPTMEAEDSNIVSLYDSEPYGAPQEQDEPPDYVPSDESGWSDASDEAEGIEETDDAQSSVATTSDADSTLELSRKQRAELAPALRLSMPDVSVVLPITEKGLIIGREETNDVVLRQRTVSRHHMRIALSGQSVVLEDMGATNPALVAGEELEGVQVVPIGTQIDVCGARLTLIRTPHTAVAAMEEKPSS